jgi:hypothetical protein
MSSSQAPNPTPALSRRTLFAGAGAVGALATAAAVLPRAEPALQAAAPGLPADPAAGGYQLTDHVKQYYATARV